MKIKLLIGLLFLFRFVSLNASAKSGDVILLDGEEWTLLGKPLESDSLMLADFLAFLPEQEIISTANWAGYTAHWEIYKEQLYLRKVEMDRRKPGPQSEIQPVAIDGVEEHFAAYKTPNGICASWFSGELRLGRGGIVRYFHYGFDRNLEEECILTIFEGKVTSKKFYKNYKEGTSMAKDGPAKIYSHFPWDDFPELKKETFCLLVKNFQVADNGDFVDCQLYVECTEKTIKDPNDPVVKAFKEVFRQLSPWKLHCLDGEYWTDRALFALPLKWGETSPKVDRGKSFRISTGSYF